MPFTTRRRHHHHHTHTPVTTTSTTRRRGLFSRGPRHRGPIIVQKRKPTIKDKVSGALTRLRGAITGRPGVKAAGTRRMHGTDGRGMHRHHLRRGRRVY